ncbi:MAG: hypothetical protein Q4C21_00845 [Oscillospiraceae bacterium]|nr:hypothetical protein [Oscillospiraceae bacterium]
MAKNILKKIVKILSAVNYVLLCVYAAMFCAYRAFDSFQSLVFYTLLQTFLNDDGVLAYLIISLPLGVIGCIILAVFSRKRKVPAAILLLSLVLQFIPLITCIKGGMVFSTAVYAIGTAAFIASAAFAIYLSFNKRSKPSALTPTEVI